MDKEIKGRGIADNDKQILICLRNQLMRKGSRSPVQSERAEIINKIIKSWEFDLNDQIKKIQEEKKVLEKKVKELEQGISKMEGFNKTVECKCCGKTFVTPSRSAKFCCTSCRVNWNNNYKNK